MIVLSVDRLPRWRVLIEPMALQETAACLSGPRNLAVQSGWPGVCTVSLQRAHSLILSSSQKSVALGALSFYMDHFVSVRMMRFAYGTNCVIEYDPQDPEHVKRRAKAYTRPSGRKVIPNNFKMILAKVCAIPM